MTDKPRNIDEYIIAFPIEVRIKLEQLRAAIQKAAPGAEEAIKYSYPTFVLNGNLVHFGAFKKHISLYAVATGKNSPFKEELTAYRQGEGSVQFPLDKPLPLGLIAKLVKHRVRQNKAKGKNQESRAKN